MSALTADTTRSQLSVLEKTQHRCLLAFVSATLILSGCSSDADSIRVYTVPREDIKQPRLAVNAESQSQERQMLGVIVPNDKTAWFFKLAGDVDLVTHQIENFRSIVESVEFAGPAPKWEMPEGWKDKLEGGMTYARMQHEASGLEATVTTLPVPESYDGVEGWRKYVLMNVNRWRGQLSLSDQDWPSMESELEEFSDLSIETRPAYFVSLVGRGSGSMRPPFAGGFGAMPGMASSPPSDNDPKETPETSTKEQATRPAVAEAEFTYETPSDWSEEPPKSSMRLLQFAVGQGEDQAELTISRAGGSIEMNMSMWQSQVEADSSEEAATKIINAAEDQTVNGLGAKVYSLGGPGGKSILLTEVPQEGLMSVFIKLAGPSETIASQRDNYIKFISSLKW